MSTTITSSQKRSDSSVHVCQDMAAIYHHVSGHEFHQPGGKAALTKEEADQVATFGRIRESTQTFSAPPIAALALEEWRVEDESPLGMKIVRKHASSQGARYTHAQLVALRPQGAKRFMLGHVRWLLQAENYEKRVAVWNEVKAG